MSGNINSFNVGGTLYGLEAESLGSPAGIDGLAFDGGDSVTRYAVCSTAASTAEKAVSIGTEFTVAAGATVYVKFTNANTASSPTLNVNSSGAYPIRQTGSVAAGSGTWAAGEILALVFDGTYWIIFGKAVGNSTTYGVVKVDTAPTQNSTNAVSSGGVFVALSGKQDTLTFDNSPIAGSSNPVKSGGIYNALAKKANLDAYPHDTASGSVASFTDGADNIPVRSLTAQIVPVQAAGTPTPESPLAISGWTGANVISAGSNLYNASTRVRGKYINASGGIGDDGNAFYSALISVNEGQTIRYGFTQGEAISFWRRLHGYDADGNWVVNLANSQNPPANATTVLTATIPSGVAYVRISGRVEDTDVFVSALADTYAPYIPTAHAISFPVGAGTVYGGTLRDNGDDTWTLTRQMTGVDLGSLSWTAQSLSGNRTAFKTPINGLPAYPKFDSVAPPNAISPVATATYQNAPAWGTNAFVFVTTSVTITGDTLAFIFDASAYSDETAFKSAMDGLYFAYETIENPTYTITEDSVQTLLGDNNIWCDTGDVSVDYRADTTLYIDGKVAALTALMSES